MIERVRFHLDENVNPIVAQALKRYGVDVTTSIDAEILTQSDDAQLEYAVAERRVIVTHDDDFLRMASQNANHWGIAYCHIEARSIGEIIRSLQLIYEVLTPEEMQGHVEFL